MKTIQLSVSEILTAREVAKEATMQQDCYAFYRERDKKYNELLQSKTDSTLRLALTGGDLVTWDKDGVVIPFTGMNPVNQIGTRKTVVSENGFTPGEYTELTGGEPVPNQFGDLLVAELNGKVYRFEQNGNVSISMGAPEYSTKYKHLVKKVSAIANVIVEIVP